MSYPLKVVVREILVRLNVKIWMPTPVEILSIFLTFQPTNTTTVYLGMDNVRHIRPALFIKVNTIAFLTVVNGIKTFNNVKSNSVQI